MPNYLSRDQLPKGKTRASYDDVILTPTGMQMRMEYPIRMTRDPDTYAVISVKLDFPGLEDNPQHRAYMRLAALAFMNYSAKQYLTTKALEEAEFDFHEDVFEWVEAAKSRTTMSGDERIAAQLRRDPKKAFSKLTQEEKAALLAELQTELEES